MKLEFHPQAELELIEAADYYELQVPGLGMRLEAEVRRATDVLLANSEIGARADPLLRRFALNRFPFTLYYSELQRYFRRPAYRGSRAPKPPTRLLEVTTARQERQCLTKY